MDRDGMAPQGMDGHDTTPSTTAEIDEISCTEDGGVQQAIRQGFVERSTGATQAGTAASIAIVNRLSMSFLSQQRPDGLRRRQTCPHCQPHKPLAQPAPQPGRQHSHASVLVQRPATYASSPDPYARRPSLHCLTETAYPTHGYVPVVPATMLAQSPLVSPMTHQSVPFSSHHAQAAPLLQTPVMHDSWSKGLAPTRQPSAAKVASSDRHKLSEKHRRDGMGAFVQAGHVLRSGINPGILARCQTCIEDANSTPSPESMATNSNSPSSTPHPTHSPCPASSSQPQLSENPRTKKPKNDMLEESMMWEFSVLLHFVPHEVGSHLDAIRDLAEQMARDKAQGQANQMNEYTKKKNWDADVRAEVLIQALRVMVEMSERHGIGGLGGYGDGGDDVVGESDQSRKRKRGLQRDELDLRTRMTAPTPPSSRGSPTFSHVPSRDVSASLSGDESGHAC